MELENEDVATFREALDKWVRSIDKASAASTPAIGNATISVNAGGVGLWIAVTCCAMMLCVTVIGSIFMTVYIEGQNLEMHRMQDYLNAIYAQAPQLKPKDSK